MSDISERKTVSKRVPQIDTLYVYNTRHNAEFTHRHQLGAGYTYAQGSVLMRAAEGEMHIYHMTAEIDGVKQGLTMVSKNGNEKDVASWFYEQIVKISKDEYLLNEFKSAGVSPSSLGLTL